MIMSTGNKNEMKDKNYLKILHIKHNVTYVDQIIWLA